VKQLLLLIFLLHYLFCQAQKTEAWYDYYWKPCEPGLARYYSTVQRTDSGWLRHDFFVTGPVIQMRALYADKDCKILNGEAQYYHANGNLQAKGYYRQHKREGLYIRYHSNGMMSDSATYSNDRPVGSRIFWHKNGYQSDSIYHVNDSTDVHISWFDTGELAGAGYVVNGEFFGKWKYYHRSGPLSGEVVYKGGKAISRQYFNEDGSPEPDTAKANRAPLFKKGGEGEWRKYLEKNLYWPHRIELVNTTQVTVGVLFSVSEQGKAEDVEITVPFHPEFDNIALKTILNSTGWQPAIQHNRKIRQWYRQSVTFQQTE
jgi:hypothetical protein